MLRVGKLVPTLLLVAFVTSLVLSLSGKMIDSDIEAIAWADTLYDIKITLSWDALYNLDLYVVEPTGEVACWYNPVTAIEGKHSGDTGLNTAPETYGLENGAEGEYQIRVNSPGEDIGETTKTYVTVVFYEGSASEQIIVFGPETLTLGGDVWWEAGTVTFCPLPDEESGCFIVTAAYNSPMAEEVKILSEFRDEYLLRSQIGKRIVNLYYRISPPIAKLISRKEFLRTTVRMGLRPVIGVSRFFLKMKSKHKEKEVSHDGSFEESVAG